MSFYVAPSKRESGQLGVSFKRGQAGEGDIMQQLLDALMGGDAGGDAGMENTDWERLWNEAMGQESGQSLDMEQDDGGYSPFGMSRKASPMTAGTGFPMNYY